MLQTEHQVVNKENDAKREKMLVIQKMDAMERERQQLLELSLQSESLKDANNLLNKENAALQDVISEQKVSLRYVDCKHFAVDIKNKTRHPVFNRKEGMR